MTNVKSNINVKTDTERRLPFQTLDEQIVVAALKSNLKKIELTTDSDGNILVDKEKNAEVYDWAVNG